MTIRIAPSAKGVKAIRSDFGDLKNKQVSENAATNSKAVQGRYPLSPYCTAGAHQA
ncbi:MAG: hypothetical protein ACYS6K_24615 [Planctomycetota bacterium]|jgi:hypothetical protein